MSELPKGWERVSLTDFVYSVPTGMPKFSGKRKYYSTGSINGKGFISEGEYLFDNRPSRANRIASEGDVFQARMQGTDKALLIQEYIVDQLFSTGFLQLRPIAKTYDSRLLFYFVKSDYFLKQRDELATGSTQIALTDSKAANLELIVPPLPEQRRIVAKLEKLLHRVDACKERLDKIPAILKRFRQSVLSAACSGRLTADWRENAKIKSSEDFYDDRFPEGWSNIISGELFEYVTSGSRGWAKYYSDKGAIFIRIGNLDHGTIALDFSSVQRVKPPLGTEGTRTRVRPNDILISITADVGMIGLVPEDIKEAYINQHVALARPKKGVNVKYLAWFLTSEEGGLKQFRELQRGMTKVGLGLDDIKQVNIAFPPLPEQQEIVRRVEALFKKADEIEARYKKTKAFVDKITQSILAKAFRGELVPQDPDDEPASALLERIKAERAKYATKKKGKKK